MLISTPRPGPGAAGRHCWSGSECARQVSGTSTAGLPEPTPGRRFGDAQANGR
ncbi:MAG: hypothetical protein LBE67_05025 [Kocuria palustris]|nr:hypothetical protein [Kocuria palustris]